MAEASGDNRHGFKPRNAVARKLKQKTYRKKGSKTGRRKTRKR